MHPADEIRGVKSSILSNKKIILGVTGSIAAVESVHLSRELIRHGADVIPIMTRAATRIIHPDSLEFATGNKPVIELTGQTEHVAFCGLTKKPADLLLISPCTANTISKIAHGIDDTIVTTFASTAIGSNVPIIVVLAMHISMYNHKILQKNINTCKKVGITFINPAIVGNKAKMADYGEITEYVIRTIGRRDLVGKKILIIGGATAEPIDEIRLITNRSSGKTAISFAKNSFERGANVELWYGYAKEPAPQYIVTKHFETIDDLLKLLKVENLKKFDDVVVCAAIADYVPKKQEGKIPSGKKNLVLELSPSPKIIEKIRSLAPKVKIIAFKVEQNKHVAKEKAYNLLKKNKLDFVVANTLDAFGKNESEIWIIDKNGKSIHKKDKKDMLTNYILDVLI